MVRVHATGGWSFAIDPEFKVVNNGDSVQAVHGSRVAYVSSLQIGGPGAPVPAAQIRAAVVRRLGSGARVSHDGPLVEGDAEIQNVGSSWRLNGMMCANGSVATCLIDFSDAGEQAWAVSVWKSLLCEGAA